MAFSSWGQEKGPSKRDVPDYRPFALRLPFLFTLFLLTCGLTAALEYLLRTLPNEDDRNGIPQDSPYSIPQRRNTQELEGAPDFHHANSVYSSATPASRHAARSQRTGATTNKAATASLLASKPQITIPPLSLKLKPNIKVPVSSLYANLDPIETYVTWAHQWYGDQLNPFARTAVLPGQEVTDKCIYNYQGIVFTSNGTGCRAIWDPSEGMAPRPGFKQASWVLSNLWIEEGSKCDGNYEEWYAGYPSNRVDTSFMAYNETVARKMGVWPYALSEGETSNDLLSVYQDWTKKSIRAFVSQIDTCTWQNDGTQSQRAVTNETISGAGSIPALYLGFFDKAGSSGGVHFPEENEPPLQVNRFIAERDYAGTLVFRVGRVFRPRGESTSAQEVAAVPGVPGLTTTPTATRGTSPQPTTPHDTTPQQTPPPAGGNFPISLYDIDITRTFQTTMHFTSAGHLTTSTLTSQLTTKVLIALPPAMQPAVVSTQTDSLGRPTATTTNFYGDPILTTLLTTLTNPSGSPLTTLVTIPATSVVKTQTDAHGNPTATVTEYPVYPKFSDYHPTPSQLILAHRTSYFFVYFFPIVLTLLVLIPITLLDAELKLLLPFWVLANTTEGAVGMTTVCLRTDGVRGIVSGWRVLFKHGYAMSVLSDALVLCAAVLVALSGETIGLKLRGTCVKQNMSTCLVTVAAFPGPARVAEGLLGGMMVLILGVGVCLWRGKTGVACHPGSVVAVGGLMQLRGVKEVLGQVEVDHGQGLGKQLTRRLKDMKFKLGRVEDGPRANNYGVVLVRDGWTMPYVEGPRGGEQGDSLEPGKMPFSVGTGERVFQGCFLGFLVGLLVLLLYYENTKYTDLTESAFEYFMDSQEFGVIMLFTGIGELISFLWGHLYSNYTTKATIARMARGPQPAAQSVLQPREVDSFTGLWQSIYGRDLLGITIAFSGVISKALPAVLSGIPFQAAQTYMVHKICAWTSITILIILILVLLGHILFVKWPDMAASPNMLAVWMYYICDSHMLRDFERLSMLSTRERDHRVNRMARLYRFGWMTGVSGKRRIGIDYAMVERGYEMKSLQGRGCVEK